MHLLDRFKQGEMRLNRIEAFSDGVFAIVVTLLVLELKVPPLKDHASVSELAHQLVELAPKFLSWLISFIIVCKFWLNHHHVLGLARHANYAMVWLNSIFLMGQSFIPFPTALMGEYPDNHLAVSFFGCVFALNTLLFIALNAYIADNLIRPELASLRDPHAHAQGDDRAGVLSRWRRYRLVQHACRLRDLRAHPAVLHHAADVPRSGRAAEKCGMTARGVTWRPGRV
jgi:TMEM175 potassium channel family protein